MSNLQPESNRNSLLFRSLDADWQKLVNLGTDISVEKREQIMNHLKGEIQAIGGKISSANWCGKDPTDLFGPEFEFSLPNIACEFGLEMLVEPREGDPPRSKLPQFFTIDAYLNDDGDRMFEGPTFGNRESKIEFLTEAVDQIRALRRSVNPDEVEVDDLCDNSGYMRVGYRFKIKPENGLNDVKKLLGLLRIFE